MSSENTLIQQISKELEKMPKENIVKVREYIQKLKESHQQSNQEQEGDPILEYLERASKQELGNIHPVSSKEIDSKLYGDAQ